MKHTRNKTTRRALGAFMLLAGMAALTANAGSLSLTGEQEVLPVITSGNGTEELIVAADGTISGSITLNRGEGNVWTVPPASKMSPDQMALYRAGRLCVNAHTETNKGGEIRTQLAY
jgi:hypothetical protein